MIKTIKLGLLVLLVFLLTLWGVRAYNAWHSPPLQLWHTFIPQELSVAEMDAGNWERYQQREEKIFADIRTNVTDALPPEAQLLSNRFFERAPIYPPNLRPNWNRSYVLEPEGKVTGAVVFLHGLTDAPYSMRHLARRYRDEGFISIGLRIPAHGTTPGALTSVMWEDWMAATRLAVREAKSRIDPSMPLHIVGFSNGGALAMKYALDALENQSLTQADRLVLISPMIGITRFARFAGIASVPAFFPAFAKSAWLGVLPEFNPFKYNSFPVNGARQSHRLTAALQQQITRLSTEGRLVALPPILTFQSVIDYTVSTPAILNSLYAHLPQNGSELVLFDVNRATVFGPLMRSTSNIAMARLLPPLPQRYSTTIITNISPQDTYTLSRTFAAGQMEPTERELGIEYPPHIFSLSHVAIPFPMDDALYGMATPPEERTRYGINLGTLEARGERGSLVVNLDALFRTTSNPFFPYLLERVVAGMEDPMPLRLVKAQPSTIQAAPLSKEYKEYSEKYLQELQDDDTP